MQYFHKNDEYEHNDQKDTAEKPNSMEEISETFVAGEQHYYCDYQIDAATSLDEAHHHFHCCDIDVLSFLDVFVRFVDHVIISSFEFITQVLS